MEIHLWVYKPIWHFMSTYIATSNDSLHLQEQKFGWLNSYLYELGWISTTFQFPTTEALQWKALVMKCKKQREAPIEIAMVELWLFCLLNPPSQRRNLSTTITCHLLSPFRMQTREYMCWYWQPYKQDSSSVRWGNYICYIPCCWYTRTSCFACVFDMR